MHCIRKVIAWSPTPPSNFPGKGNFLLGAAPAGGTVPALVEVALSAAERIVFALVSNWLAQAYRSLIHAEAIPGSAKLSGVLGLVYVGAFSPIIEMKKLHWLANSLVVAAYPLASA